MTQQPIDLLPSSIRASCQAGVRTGQYIASVSVAIVLVVVLATHQRFEHRRVSEQLARTVEKSAYVLQLEEEANKLKYSLNDAEAMISLQQRLAWPVGVSDLLATVVNQIPESVALDRIDIDAGARRPGRSPRTRSVDDRNNTRLLRAEMAGFATSDEEIAELIARLHTMPPFQSVTLDFSRSRSVWGIPAREFRMSFRIDFDEPYEVVQSTDASRGDSRRSLAQRQTSAEEMKDVR